jgi:hypothetical protein
LQKLAHAINFAACKVGYCIKIDQWLDAFLSILKKEQSDPDAQLILSLGYSPDVDLYIPCSMPTYAKPVADPPVFDAFKRLRHVYSSNRVANFSTFHKELDNWNPGEFRFVNLFSFALALSFFVEWG